MTDATDLAQPVEGNRAPSPNNDRGTSNSNHDGETSSSKDDDLPLNRDARNIRDSLKERRALMRAAIHMEKDWLTEGGAVILQRRPLGAQPASQSASQSTSQSSSQPNGQPTDPSASQPANESLGQPGSRAHGRPQSDTAVAGDSPKDVLNAVKYRLAITDLFIEKAQYYLGKRALIYSIIGILLYCVSVGILIYGIQIAVHRMNISDSGTVVQDSTTSSIPSDLASPPRAGSASPALTSSGSSPPTGSASLPQAGSSSPTQTGSAWQDRPGDPAASKPPSPRTADVTVQEPAASSRQEATESPWIRLLHRFIVAFTAYGFIVLTAVALARIARACLDQRERLLAKRHSLRQGRLYLHLTGGNVTIEEIEHAFDWNHEQYNAFTHTPTDAKAPWGTLLGEIVKVTPELVKAGVSAAQEAKKTENSADKVPKVTIGSSR